jgi:hypothetical protein
MRWTTTGPGRSLDELASTVLQAGFRFDTTCAIDYVQTP